MGDRSSRGFTLIELLIVVAIIGIIAAIATPGLLRSRMAANEASAVATVRSVSSANVAFHAACGAYAVGFTVLLDNGFLPDPLGGAPPVRKSGYEFDILVGAGGAPGGSGQGYCAGAHTAFFTTAVPISSTSGQRSFALREPGTIFQDLTGAPIADPPAIGGNVVGLQ